MSFIPKHHAMHESRKQDGRLQAVEPNLYYSPNSTRDLILPRSPISNPFLPTPNKDGCYVFDAIKASDYYSPLWWSPQFEWAAFIPRHPILEGPILGTLHRSHKLYHHETQGFAMPRQRMLRWSLLERDLSLAIVILAKHSGTSLLLPVLPSIFGFKRFFKTKEEALHGIERSRQWFSIWIGAFCYVVSAVMAKSKLQPGFVSWEQALVQSGCHHVWIEGVLASGCLERSLDRAGTLLCLEHDEHRIDFFLDNNVPVWYKWDESTKFSAYGPTNHQRDAFLKAPRGQPPWDEEMFNMPHPESKESFTEDDLDPWLDDCSASFSNPYDNPVEPSALDEPPLHAISFTSIDTLESFINETCSLQFGFTGPLPKSHPVQSYDIAAQKNFLKLLGIQWTETRADVFTRGSIASVHHFLESLASKQFSSIPEDEWDLSRTHRQTMYLNSRLATIRRLVGEDNKVYYMFVLPDDNNWHITTTWATHALMICRLDHSYDSRDLAMYLMNQGTPFHTMQSAKTLTRAPPSSITTALQTPRREKDYVFTLKDHEIFSERLLTYTKLSSRAARAGLKRGGYVWRTCNRIAFSFVLDGPVVWSTDKDEYILAVDTSTGDEYIDEKLTDKELELFCGMYECLTGHGLQVARKSWYPFAVIFENSGQDYGMWTENSENIFKIVSDNVPRRQPLSTLQWNKQLKGSKQLKRILLASNEVADRLLNICGHPAKKQPARKKSPKKKSADAQPANDQPADNQPADAQPAKKRFRDFAAQLNVRFSDPEKLKQEIELLAQFTPRLIAPSTQYYYDRIKRMYLVFFEWLYQSRAKAEATLEKGADLPPITHLKLFIKSAAETGGSIFEPNKKGWSWVTTRSFISGMRSMFVRHQTQPIAKEDLTQLYNLAKTLAIRDKTLSTRKRVKRMVKLPDLVLLNKMALDQRTDIQNTYSRLQLNALTCFLYHHGLRPGSILLSPRYYHTDHYLQWGHCEFYIVGWQDGVGALIQSYYSLHYMKNHRGVEGDFLKVSATTLPRELMHVDSQGHLVILGVANGVFDVDVADIVSSKEKVEALDFPYLLKIRDDSKQRPVFTQLREMGKDGKYLPLPPKSDDIESVRDRFRGAMTISTATHLLVTAADMAGFIGMTFYSLRYGFATDMANKLPEQHFKHLLGHSQTSNLAYSTYQVPDREINVTSLRYDVPTTMHSNSHSSVSFNTTSPLSPADEKILFHPKVTTAIKRFESCAAAVVEVYACDYDKVPEKNQGDTLVVDAQEAWSDVLMAYAGVSTATSAPRPEISNSLEPLPGGIASAPLDDTLAFPKSLTDKLETLSTLHPFQIYIENDRENPFYSLLLQIQVLIHKNQVRDQGYCTTCYLDLSKSKDERTHRHNQYGAHIWNCETKAFPNHTRCGFCATILPFKAPAGASEEEEACISEALKVHRDNCHAALLTHLKLGPVQDPEEEDDDDLTDTCAKDERGEAEEAEQEEEPGKKLTEISKYGDGPFAVCVQSKVADARRSIRRLFCPICLFNEDGGVKNRGQVPGNNDPRFSQVVLSFQLKFVLHPCSVFLDAKALMSHMLTHWTFSDQRNKVYRETKLGRIDYEKKHVCMFQSCAGLPEMATGAFLTHLHIVHKFYFIQCSIPHPHEDKCFQLPEDGFMYEKDAKVFADHYQTPLPTTTLTELRASPQQRAHKERLLLQLGREAAKVPSKADKITKKRDGSPLPTLADLPLPKRSKKSSEAIATTTSQATKKRDRSLIVDHPTPKRTKKSPDSIVIVIPDSPPSNDPKASVIADHPTCTKNFVIVIPDSPTSDNHPTKKKSSEPDSSSSNNPEASGVTASSSSESELALLCIGAFSVSATDIVESELKKLAEYLIKIAMPMTEWSSLALPEERERLDDANIRVTKKDLHQFISFVQNWCPEADVVLKCIADFSLSAPDIPESDVKKLAKYLIRNAIPVVKWPSLCLPDEREKLEDANIRLVKNDFQRLVSFLPRWRY
ncbi:hypothetical protein D9613_004290 [Agrocybe pediades]|uniref:Uncharacterized protein n=1 Tax=Agrocybe pediades TaxID=84607 RepID=A0A8H4VLN0_9AGAR|nr:hypothetical protein D9613_004290 [Agrocybe pediades]